MFELLLKPVLKKWVYTGFGLSDNLHLCHSFSKTVLARIFENGIHTYNELLYRGNEIHAHYFFVLFLLTFLSFPILHVNI